MGKLNSVAMVAMMGNIFCKTIEEKNNWKKRMLNTIDGADFPDDCLK